MIHEGQTFPSNFYEQVDMSKISYFCFNPICPQSSLRFFSQLEQHNSQCGKWISNLKTQQPPSSQNQERMTFEPFAYPIQTLLQSQGMQQSTINKLSDYMSRLKQLLIKNIDIAQMQVQKQIRLYFQPMIHCGAKILNLMNLVKNNCSNGARAKLMMVQILGHENFGKAIKRQDMVFLQKCQQIQHNLVQNISNIPQTIFQESSRFFPDTLLPSSLKHSLSEYLLNPQDDHTKKMSKISNLLKQSQKQIYEKIQKPLAPLLLKVRCSICNINFTTDKKKEMMKIWKLLSEHLIQKHLQEIGYVYRYCLEAGTGPTITLEEILYKMKTYKYEALELIYKNGRKMYNTHFQNRNRLTIEYLHKGQSQSSCFPSVTLAQTSQFNIFTVILAFQLQKSLGQQKNIYVYCCGYSQLMFFKRMMDLFILKNLIIVESKKNDQSNIVYHEEFEGQDWKSEQKEDEERKSVN